MKEEREIVGILRGFDDYLSIFLFKRYGIRWCCWIVINIIIKVTMEHKLKWIQYY